ncbi:MAG TPA: secretin N-terminal domain-containing protein [Chlamydiales bacterium]|nr:secretin N-terminal domain-containing protein [Chlamydiales bacterium]
MRLNSVYFLFLASILPLFSEENQETAQLDIKDLALTLKSPHVSSGGGFTINYNNVSMTEYLKFVSKICNVNFLFDEEDMNFPVTIVSEDPITPENVMATLIQTLRIHGLSLLEQDKNLVIHKNPSVKQFAKLVFDNEPIDTSYPIITKVFHILDAKAEAVAEIIRPMLSADAILDVSKETQIVIITDITPNVEKATLLIDNLKAPQNAITIEPYHVKYNDPEFLIALASQIMAPMTQGHPFILASQPKAHVIFIVSNPSIVEKTITVLTNLDTAPKKEKSPTKELKAQNVFIYKVKNRSLSEILKGLKEISQNIHMNGYMEKGLLETIDSAKPIKETNSLLLTGEPDSLNKIREILETLDVASREAQLSERESFFMYIPKNRTVQDVHDGIQEVANNLKKSKIADKDLVETLESAKVVPTTQSIVFTGDPLTFPKVQEVLASVDVLGQVSPGGKTTFFVYPIKVAPAEQLQESLKEFAKDLEKSIAHEDTLVHAIKHLKYIKDTNSLMFTADERTLKRLQDLLPSFDQDIYNQRRMMRAQFFVYKPQVLKGEDIAKALKDMEENLKSSGLADQGLLTALDSMRWVKSTNSFIFTGDADSIKKLNDLINSIDSITQPKPGHERTFFVYQLQYAPKDKVEKYLSELADNLKKKGIKEDDLIEAIHSMKWIPESHSYMFSGTQTSLNRIKDILGAYDIPLEHAIAASQPTFILYPLANTSKEQMEDYLKQIAHHLNRNDEKQANLYKAIYSMKWIEPSHSFMLSGTKDALDQIQLLAQEFDIPANKAYLQSTFALYQLKYVSKSKMEEYLKELIENIKKSGVKEENLVKALQSGKWIPESRSFMFTGTQPLLDQITTMLEKFDTEEESSKPSQQTYLVYKLINTTGDVIEEDLEQFAKKMKSSGFVDKPVLHVIEHAQWIKETNSILLTGDAQSINEVKNLITQFDVKREKGTDFLMYKPQCVTPAFLESSLKDIGENLKKADLADPALLKAIASGRYNESTQSMIYTGSPATLQKLEALIKEIDIPVIRPVQCLGKTTFMLFKLKVANGQQVIKSLNAVAEDIKRSGASDKDFLAALASVRYIRETNSLLFTGTEGALEKIKPLVEKFDVPELGKIAPTVGPSSFFIYKPQYVPGPDLEKSLLDFVDHLQESGVPNTDLYNTVHTMKWVEKSSSLIFTGTDKSLEQVKELLKTFDVQQKRVGPEETSIQAVDNTSFLVYKLQYHRGDEIQSALKQIGGDLIQSKSNVNSSLLNAIHSIQWLQVTNSLLVSGDGETLTRLKELIKNLDVPLKQVFIEVLIIQTTMTNLMNFGLNWGSKFQVSSKFSGSMFNLNNSASGKQFGSNLSGINASDTPSPTQIPIETAFDLGVIGDIIMHKGKSFISLGSLLQALQTDSDTSILMNPKLISQDNKTATIFIGQNIPFIGSFLQNFQQNTLNTTNVEYRDIGMNLSITPVLGNSDIVTLDISLDNTAVPANAQGQVTNISVGNVTGITTSKTTMQTTVHVPDESFLVLSGMVDTSRARVKTGIPCLGGIPFIGAALTSLATADTQANIVIFLRPHIINSYEDMKRVTQDQEDLFREQAGSGFLDSQVDEGMELIKSLEDD